MGRYISVRREVLYWHEIRKKERLAEELRGAVFERHRTAWRGYALPPRCARIFGRPRHRLAACREGVSEMAEMHHHQVTQLVI